MKNSKLIFSVAGIRAIEEAAASQLHLTSTTLMQRAGNAAFTEFLAHFTHAKNMAVFVGNGNNGGDGYVFALAAHQAKLSVTVWQVGEHDHLSFAAKAAYDACVEKKIVIRQVNTTADFSGCDVIIDAICGIGLQKTLRQDVQALLEKIEQLQKPIVALDIPTGIDADTGAVHGKALHAELTITFIGLKLGLLTGSGIASVGKVVCCDLSLPSELLQCVTPVACRIELNMFVPYFKPRAKDWHKGLSGHVVIVGGDFGYSGAPQMAALAALRVGAGLVSIATREEHVAAINIPEIMSHGIKHAEDLLPLLQRAKVIVIGPGLGTSEWAKSILQLVLKQPQPLVIDADGLNLLAQTKEHSERFVLTPHPGEAARLLQVETSAVQENRLQALTAICQRYAGVCVLKGAGTLIAEQHAMPLISTHGNPGMATAGMGDVLSGVIAGLIAQGLAPFLAAQVGVCLHGSAGDLAAKMGERGMLATDLMPYLRELVNSLVEQNKHGDSNDQKNN